MARQKQTKPYVEAMFGCAAAPVTGGTAPLAQLLALALAVMMLVGRRCSLMVGWLREHLRLRSRLRLRPRARLWGMGLVVGLAVAVGCGDGDELFAEREEERRIANELTEGLQLEGAVIVAGVAPEAQLDGPRLEAVFGPPGTAPGQPFSLRLAVKPQDAVLVQSAVLQLMNAESHLRIPLTVDRDSAVATIGAVLRTDLGPLEFPPSGLLMVQDDGGKTGPGIVLEFYFVPEIVEEQGEILTIAAHRGSTLALGFAHRGDKPLLFTGGYDQTIAVWDLESGHQLRRFVGHSGAVLSLDATEDAAYVVSGAQDHTVRIWDVDSGAVARTHGDYLDYVSSVQFSWDGTLLASGCWDGAVRVRQMVDGALVQRLDVDDRVNAVFFNTDNDLLAAGAGRLLFDGRVVVWNTQSWEQLFTFDVEREVTALAFSPDGQTLAAAVGRGDIHIFSMVTGDTLHVLTGGPADTIPSMGFWPANPDQLGAVTLSGFRTIWSISGESVVRSASTKRALTAAIFSRDGAYAAFGDVMGQVNVLPVSIMEP